MVSNGTTNRSGEKGLLPIGDARYDGLKCLHLLCRHLMRIFPFFHNLAILFSEIVIFMINW